MLDYDLSFNYKFVIRHNLLLVQYVYINSFKLPFLKTTRIAVSFKQQESLDADVLMSYFYLLRFFLGKKAFVTKYKSFFSLRKTYYSYTIICDFHDKQVFIPLYFF